MTSNPLFGPIMSNRTSDILQSTFGCVCDLGEHRWQVPGIGDFFYDGEWAFLPHRGLLRDIVYGRSRKEIISIVKKRFGKI